MEPEPVEDFSQFLGQIISALIKNSSFDKKEIQTNFKTSWSLKPGEWYPVVQIEFQLSEDSLEDVIKSTNFLEEFTEKAISHSSPSDCEESANVKVTQMEEKN